MIRDIDQAIRRTGASLWRDLVGMAALALTFFTLLEVASLLSAA
jgi:hypothetical protein